MKGLLFWFVIACLCWESGLVFQQIFDHLICTGGPNSHLCIGILVSAPSVTFILGLLELREHPLICLLWMSDCIYFFLVKCNFVNLQVLFSDLRNPSTVKPVFVKMDIMLLIMPFSLSSYFLPFSCFLFPSSDNTMSVKYCGGGGIVSGGNILSFTPLTFFYQRRTTELGFWNCESISSFHENIISHFCSGWFIYKIWLCSRGWMLISQVHRVLLSITHS